MTATLPERRFLAPFVTGDPYSFSYSKRRQEDKRQPKKVFFLQRLFFGFIVFGEGR